jgi:Holliday junction resolvase
MRYWRRAKRDVNHAGIVAGLRAAGCSVLELHAVGSGCPDLLVGRSGLTALMEIKRPGREKPHGASELATAAAQAAFAEAWRGCPVLTVSSLEEALRALGVRARLSPALEMPRLP